MDSQKASTDPVISDLWIHKDSFKVWNEKQNTHRREVLGLDSCPWDQLFNTDRAGLVSEAAMLKWILMFADAKGLRNLNVGGFRMDDNYKYLSHLKYI